MKILYFVTLCFLFPPALSANTEIVKWTDENGVVHFGDRVPEKYRNTSEKVELKEQPKLGLTQQELRKLGNRVESYKASIRNKDAEQKKLQTKREREYANRPKKHKPKPLSASEKKEALLACRDKWSGKRYSKQRIACFKAVDSGS